MKTFERLDQVRSKAKQRNPIKKLKNGGKEWVENFLIGNKQRKSSRIEEVSGVKMRNQLSGRQGNLIKIMI